MRKIMFITVILLIFGTNDIYSQIKEIVYFERNLSASELPSDYMKVISKHKKNKIVVEEFRFNIKNWKSIEKNTYKKISDSVFINTNIAFNEKSIIWNTYTPYKIIITQTGTETFHFKEVNYHNIVLREGFCKSYFPLIKHGEVKEYYVQGLISNITQYKNNRFISSERWMMDGRKSLENVYTEVTKMPGFEGKSLKKFYAKLNVAAYLHFNPERDESLDGVCSVEFIVKSNGSIENMLFIENSDVPDIDLQVYKFVRDNKDDWSPAEIANNKVDYVMRISYGFNRAN